MIDIEKIKSEIKVLPAYDDQIMLQTPKGISDPFYGTDWKGKRFYEDFTEFTFKSLKYTNEVIHSLNIVGTRILRLYPKTCYSYHRDRTQRVHIPIITNDNCFFVIEDKIKRCPANGNHYLIDTTQLHTFVNASKQERIHIVGLVTT